MIPARTLLEREAETRETTGQRAHERAVVAEHYQHDPRIFELFLDRRLAYSTGIFAQPDEGLESAQARKYAYIADALRLRPGERALDVGCGWGSNLLYLAEHSEAELLGITLSSRQREVALERARAAGVAERVKVELCHIEELELEPESVDAVLFVGSIVHMHHREEVHRRVGRWLRPGGRVLISDCYFPKVVRGNRDSAAARYIFETALGYCRLIGLSEELGLLEEQGIDVVELRDLTSSYLATLERWIDGVRANRQRIDALAPGFAKVLQTYMTVAKLTFQRRHAIEYMITLAKPEARR